MTIEMTNLSAVEVLRAHMMGFLLPLCRSPLQRNTHILDVVDEEGYVNLIDTRSKLNPSATDQENAGLPKCPQVAEEAYSVKESLGKYFMRNQRRMQEAKESAELLGEVNGESSHVLRISDDEARAMQRARNFSRMLEDAYSTGVAILSNFLISEFYIYLLGSISILFHVV